MDAPASVGEIPGLTTANCDFRANTITIDHTLTYFPPDDAGTREYHIVGSAPRTFPMTQGVRDAVSAQGVNLKLQNIPYTTLDGCSNFLFLDEQGDFLKTEDLNDAIREIVMDYNKAEFQRSLEEGRQPVLLPVFTVFEIRSQAMPPLDHFEGEYYCLSNYYDPVSVTVDGLTYRNSEAAFHAYKTTDMNKRREFTDLNPDAAKKKGRHLDLPSDWDDIRIDVMKKVVRAKFTQHPDPAKKLPATGNRELIEGTKWHDTFWGIDLNTRKGDNNLGKILMALREDLRSGKIPLPDDKQ